MNTWLVLGFWFAIANLVLNVVLSLGGVTATKAKTEEDAQPAPPPMMDAVPSGVPHPSYPIPPEEEFGDF